MNKILLIGIVSLFLVGIVYAGTIALSNARSLTIDNSPVEIQEKQADTISFNCDGTPMSVEGSEPDGKYDKNDLTSLVSTSCEGTATDIEVNSVTMYEFNGEVGTYTEIRGKECSSLGGTYDAGKDSCSEIEQLEGSGDYIG